MNIKIDRWQPIVATMILQIRRLGFLLFTLVVLTKCGCDNIPQATPPTRSDSPDQKPNLPNEPNPEDALIPITEDMITQVETSLLDSIYQTSLVDVLKLFKSNQEKSQSSKKLDLLQYRVAMTCAMKLADKTIIQALLQRKDQVKGSIDLKIELQEAITFHYVVGVQALLKSGIKANKEHLKTAVEGDAPVAIIKTLLDPKLNPQAAELIDQELLKFALIRALYNKDADGNFKVTLFALLDPQVNAKVKTLINQDMLEQAVYYKSEDILQKLLNPQINAHASQLTDEEMIKLINSTFLIRNSESILKVLLEDLIRKNGKAYMRNLMGKAHNGDSIEDMLSIRDSNKPIFIALGLIDATN